MKFQKIKMTNFMRYRDVNEIEFSCDPEKNVTVVLGNNTFGKTTIAQAFRWGLYGEIINTNYDKKTEVCLLNNEVLAEMDANARKEVSVEITVTDGMREYEFVRTASFVRKYPQFIAIQRTERLVMRTREKNKAWGSYVANDGEKTKGVVDDTINMLFPQNLSTYFLFDGERWNDEKAQKEDIKSSIATIIGISSLDRMRFHLKEYGTQGSKSVIKLLRKKTLGSDSRTEAIEKELEFLIRKIEECNTRIEAARNAIEIYENRVKASEEILESNKKIEEEQKEAKRLERAIDSAKTRIKNLSIDLVKSFGNDGYKVILGDLPSRAARIIQSVDNLDGTVIPNVNDQTIYYILEKGKCICGCDVTEESEQYEHLMRLLNVVPPKMIGGEIRIFTDKVNSWSGEASDRLEAMTAKADMIESEKAELEDLEDELYRINKRIDGRINFAQERQRMTENKRKVEENREIIRKAENNISDFQRRYRSLEGELEELARLDEEARKFRLMVAYAEEILKITEEQLKKKEVPLRDNLNQKLRENYVRMFREKEKYAQLGEDYRLHLYYRNISKTDGLETMMEEKTLSEGEKIACNFVFIVSILELAKEALEEESAETVVTLPLVLDGPFSKLSGDNTGLIAKVLPNAAEQVIVFMLDKDWDASGLELSTDRTYKYRVNKETTGNSACIIKEV